VKGRVGERRKREGERGEREKGRERDKEKVWNES
jgi:hypothetical protein